MKGVVVVVNGKVLIVDSDRNICELLRMCLEKEGFMALVANDGEEGLAQFSALKPDIILSEVTLPSVDGWQICREVRKIRHSAHIHHLKIRGVRQGFRT